MANAKYIYRGESIEYTNATANAIEHGSVVSLGTRVGVAGGNIAAGETGAIHVVGVFALPKAASVEIAQGAAVYFNVKNGNVTTTDTDVPCGWAAAAATSTDTVVFVKIG